MIHSKWQSTLDFLKATAIGGVLFLLPLAGLAFILGYVYRMVASVFTVVQKWIPIESTLGIALLFLISIVIVVLACFAVGLLATRSLAQKSSELIEKQLLKVFPKYAIYKDILAGTLGGQGNAPSLRPVRVRLQETYRLAFESDRSEDGLVTVFFPGAPDPWSGYVAWVDASQVESLDTSFSEAVSQCERLGRPK